MRKLVLVCIGGALGSGARYLVGLWAADAFGPTVPAGTLAVNVAGSLLISLVMALSARSTAIPAELRLFLTSGFMGGLTTYSSFNAETLRLARDGSAGQAALYVGVTVTACLGAGALGLAAARRLGTVRPGTAP